jgi:hypothetical protein
MVHARRFVGLKDREFHLSLKLLVGKARFKEIIGSRHANNMPGGGLTSFGDMFRV